MKIELMRVVVGDLKIGDEYHDDTTPVTSSPAAVDPRGFVHGDNGSIFKVINTPFASTNAQLFWDSIGQECVVVPVEYFDGARGSRLYDPDTSIIIRRDINQK